MNLVRTTTLGLAAALVVAGATTTACEREQRPPPEADAVTTQVSLFNATHDVLPIGVRSVSSDYAVDCGLVVGAPDRYLDDVHLTSSRDLAGRIDADPVSGLEVPVPGERDSPGFSTPCMLAFLDLETDDDRLEPVALTWPRDLAEKTVYPDVSADRDVPPEDQTLVAEADYREVDDEELRPWRHRPCGGDLENCEEEEYQRLLEPPAGAEYGWEVVGDEPTLHPWDPEPIDERRVVEPDDQQCRTGRDATPLRWDSPPSGSWWIEEVRETTIEFDDGEADADAATPGGLTPRWRCWDLELVDEAGDDDDQWRVCGSELLAMRLTSEAFDGDVRIDFFTEQQDGSPPSVYEALTIDLERWTAEGDRWEVETIELVRGHGVPGHIGLEWDAEPATACEPVREIDEVCNQVSLPAHLTLDVGGTDLRIEPGMIEALDPQADRRLEHVRGMYRAVSDLRCHDERLGPDYMNHPGAYLEFVYYPGASVVYEE